MDFPHKIGTARVWKTPAGLRIAIPVYQTWSHFLLTPFSACIAILLVRRLHDLPMWLFLIVCALSAMPWARWIWRSAGRQMLTLNRVSLRVRYDLLGLGWQRDYLVKEIYKLRYLPVVRSTDSSSGLDNRTSFGRIRFDYGPESHWLEGRFSEVDARQLIALLEEYAAAPLTQLNLKLDRPRPDGAIAEEIHRGTGGLLLFSWLGGMPYCIVMFSESSSLRLAAGALWAAMVVIGVFAEFGYRYRFTSAGL
jgi:4-amino-4-deoxy-L-arabinose transferase-like glycosyltransferase